MTNIGGQATVMDLAVKNPITVHPETPLSEAVEIIVGRGFAGLPVVDKQNMLVGIITQQDLMIRNSSIYLPTFIKLLKEFEVYQRDRGLIKDDIQKIAALRVKDVMNTEPISVRDIEPIANVIQIFSEHHRVNPIPILDPDHRVIAVVSRVDLIKLLGIPSVHLSESPQSERQLDQNLTRFMNDFERQFIVVSKFRSRYWVVFSILFTVVGFIIAFALILKMR